MNKISQIISKEVISIYECVSVGFVKDVFFNKNLTKAKSFIIFNDESEIENQVRNFKIYCLTEEGILIRNTSKIEIFTAERNNPINKKVVSLSGKDFGKVTDVIIDEKCSVISIITTIKEIKPNIIVANGLKHLIINDAEIASLGAKKITQGRFRPRIAFKTNNEDLKDIKVKIVQSKEENNYNSIIENTKTEDNLPQQLKQIENNENTNFEKILTTQLKQEPQLIIQEEEKFILEQTQIHQNEKKELQIENEQAKIFNHEKQSKEQIPHQTQIPQIKRNSVPIFPSKISSEKGIIGKKIAQTIIGINNEVIIRKNNIISAHTLEVAKKHNKINELLTHVSD